MSHFDRGFVVPVWVHFTMPDGSSGWVAAWADLGRDYLVRDLPGARTWRTRGATLCPRDPNRAGGGDRPQE